MAKKRYINEEGPTSVEVIDLKLKELAEELKNLKDQETVYKAKISAAGVQVSKATGVTPLIVNKQKQRGKSELELAKAELSNLLDTKNKIDLQISNLNKEKEELKKVSPEQQIKSHFVNTKPLISEKKNENKMTKLTKKDIINIVESHEPARMTKRELVESITNRLLLSEDMDDDLRSKIESGEHDYSEHIDPETVKRMANDIVRAAKENIESRGGTADFDGATRIMTQGLMGALQKESRHKEELQDLAIKLVSEEYNIPEGSVDFEVEITGHPQMGGKEISKTGLQLKRGEKNKTAPEGKTTEELKSKVTKRRLLNAMIHGAARKGQNLFHAASDELRRIDPTLAQDYSKLMAGNDFMYWALDDETIEREGQSGTHAGQVKLYVHGNPPQKGSKPKIVAQGMTFPLLLHELTKGVLELISQWGREPDEQTRDYVEDQTDNLESETMDIRLGVKIWEKVLESMGVDALPYKAQIFTQLSSLNENEFNGIVNGLLNDSEDAIEKMRDIVYEVIRENNEHEVEEAMKQFREPEEKGGDEGPVAPEDEEEDDLLARLLGNNKGGEEQVDDFNNWSKRELETARDEALDDGDYSKVAFYQTIIDEKFY